MFHSAECQIQCPITQQIKAKGPPPLPSRLIIEEMPQYTSHRKKGLCQKRERDTCTHKHGHIHIRGSIPQAKGLRDWGWLSQTQSVYFRQSLSVTPGRHTEASQCWSQTTMKNRRSEHSQNVKINQVEVLLYLCVCVCVCGRKCHSQFFCTFFGRELLPKINAAFTMW